MTLISIAIPSKNGRDYLAYAIRSVLAQPISDLELIVSVDGDSALSEQLTEQFNDPRIKVIQPPASLSMAAHYEWCISHMSGEWQTILGQDDGLLPDFSKTLEQVLPFLEGELAVSFKRAYYFWPGCDELYGDKSIEVSGSDKIFKVDSTKMLQNNLKGTNQHYDLPQLYTNNLIHKSVIEEIKSKSNGIFYHELTPDVYSGVAIALELSSWLRVEHPAFWTGTSPSSAGMSIAKSNRDFSSDQSIIASGHIRSAELGGYSFSPLVGKDLWLASNVSPIMALSAIHSCPYAKPDFLSKKNIYLSFSSVIAISWLSKIPGIVNLRDPERAIFFLKEKIAEQNLNMSKIYFIATCLVPQIISSRIIQIFRKLLIYREGFSFSSQQRKVVDISEANIVYTEWMNR